jgi:hypothetical protein
MIFLRVTYTTEFPLGGPDSGVMHTISFPYSPDDPGGVLYWTSKTYIKTYNKHMNYQTIKSSSH